MHGLSPIFPLLTDIGAADPYVGQMKAALLSRAPSVPILDISHEVPPFSVPTGAFFLSASRKHFPAGTIFIAVVDPGVGSDRPILCVAGKDHILLGPDNGLLSLAYHDMAKEGTVTAYHIAVPENICGSTFHGRDVLAPAAARLAKGTPPFELGAPLRSPLALPAWAEADVSLARFAIMVLRMSTGSAIASPICPTLSRFFREMRLFSNPRATKEPACAR
jgi:S-adenosylmethionine hydrolase